jgi:hypothetical protein
MSNFRTVDQEIIKGAVNGCNYAPRVRVLARTQDLLLLWVPGSSVWSGMYGTQYHGAEMRVVMRREHGQRELISGLICSGVRFKQSIFKDFATEIDKHLGEGFHALLETKKTIIVGDNEPFSIYGNELPVTPRRFGYEKFQRQIALREKLVAEGITGIELEMRVQGEA